MLDIVIKQKEEHESRIMRVCACVYLSEKLTKKEARKIIENLDDGMSNIEWFPNKNSILIKTSIPDYVLPWSGSTKKNNKVYEEVVNNFKPLLKLGKVKIAENRFPLETIIYELK